MRAIAVLPVILFHSGIEFFQGGFVGVDVFFVISGYLITSIIINEINSGNFSIAKFYERRARRIFPALFFVLAACIPFAYLWMLPEQLEDFALSVVSTVLFFSNFLFWSESGYFSTASELKPLLHTWSLAVEEQFYIFFPLLLIFLARFKASYILPTLIGISVLSLALAEFSWRVSTGGEFFLSHTRFWELLAGATIALLGKEPRRICDNILSVIGLALIVFSILVFDATYPFPSLYTLVPVIGAALVIHFGTQGTLVARFLSCKIFVMIGLISYSAYLWHQPLFAFARLRSIGEPSHILMIGLSIASLLLAWATWKYVEQPFRKKRVSVFSQRRNIFWASGVAGSLLISIGLVGALSNGLPDRFDPMQLEIIDTAAASPMRDECHSEPLSDFSAEESCVYFGNSPEIAIYGNSHGVELAYGLAQYLEPSGRSIQHFTVSGCPVSYGRTTEPYCNEFYDDRLSYILEQEDIQHVILTYRTDLSGSDGAQSLVSLANHLNSQGKHVILVLQAPLLPADVSSFVYHAILNERSDVLASPREEWRSINDHVYSELENIHPDISVVDLADVFCDEDACYAVRNSEALYFDDDHMSLSGARLSARAISEEL
ncbi:acyltransferase family protein [Gymnodinialimonas sp. 2305UL16-5]|uniref:acyltransferase family protein n=1 Tax=Gymnodinialimonas mytili TaxID=3126503 RepID=UPI0030A80F18